MSTAEAKRSFDLCPVNKIEDRRQAMRRVIGPLCTFATVEAVDMASANEEIIEHTAELVSEHGQSAYHKDKGRWLDSGYATLQQIVAQNAYANNSHATTTFAQEQIMKEHTYNERLTALVSEGFDAQRLVTFRLAVPAVIAAESGARDKASLLACIEDMHPRDVAGRMLQPDFIIALHALSIARNGAYGTVSHDFVGGGPVFARPLMASVKPTTTLYDMFERVPEGVILSQNCRRDLKSSLKVQPDSRGCPVNLQASYVRPSDFREDQWERMTGGENPIMSYDHQANKLTVKRSAITAMNGLLAAVVERVEP